MNKKFVLISDTFECSTYERNHNAYPMRHLGNDGSAKHYAFKVEKDVVRMKVDYDGDTCVIEQTYPDASTKLTLSLKKQGVYHLEMKNGYALDLVTETSLIKVDEFELKLKYNLYDGTSKEVLSMVEISIVGEE